MDKEIDAYELATANYPHRWGGLYNQLSLIHIDMGLLKRYWVKAHLTSIGTHCQSLPDPRRGIGRIISAWIASLRRKCGRWELMVWMSGNVSSNWPMLRMDNCFFAREIQWFAGKPEDYLSFGLQAANLEPARERRESHKLGTSGPPTLRRLGLRYVADEYEEPHARADALAGNCQTVRRLGRPEILFFSVWRKRPQRQKLAAETFENPTKLEPSGMPVQLPERQAMIALQRDEPAKSVALLASASPYERAYPDAIYVRGLAYLLMIKARKEPLSFRKLWTTRTRTAERPGSPPIGTGLFTLVSGNGPRLCARGRHFECEMSVPGFLRTLERCRP